MATVARKVHEQEVEHISMVINYNSAGATTGIEFPARLPAGAVIDKTTVLTTTAFNGTTSVALSVGFTGTGTDLINGTDVRTATARVDTVAPVGVAKRASDTQLFASLAFGGTTGSAGSATVIVYYIPAVG